MAIYDISDKLEKLLQSFYTDYLRDMLNGRHLHTAYAEDIAGYIWTRNTSTPKQYDYRNTQHKHDSNDARIMTFNIQRIQPHKERNIWQRLPWFSEGRLWRIIDVFHHFMPDIVCLQEIQPGMAYALYQETPTQYACVESDMTPVHQTLPNLIMYNKERYTLLDINRDIINEEQHRLIVSATVHDHVTDTIYDILNVHQDDIFYEHRDDLQDTGFDILYRLTRHTSRPYVLCGDFNAPYATITHQLPHTRHAYTGDRASWITWESDDYRCIDTICYDHKFPIRVSQSEIVVGADEVGDNNIVYQDHRASDHRPLYADLRWPS